jgi:type I restriction enzyme S subunit
LKPYPEYKNSGIDWIKEIPEGWEIKKLKFIGESIIGVTYSPNEISNEKRGVLVLRASNIQDGCFSLDDCVYIEKEIQEKHFTKEGDILLCARSGSAHLVGKSAYVDKNNVGHSFGAFMTVARSQLGKYLYYFFNSEFIRSQIGLFTTTTINQLTSNILNNFSIIFPSSKARKQIVEYLDHKTSQIDSLIEKKKGLIELLEEERSAIINEAVTKGLDPNVPMKDSGIEWLGEIPAHWKMKKLKYLTTKIGSGITPRGGSAIYVDTGIPLLRSQNIHFNGLLLDDVAYISEDIFAEMLNTEVLTGDILLNITGASIGRCYYVDESLGKANVNQHVCIIRPNDYIETKYLYLILASNVGQTQVFNCQTGANRQGLNFEQLGNFVVPYPSKKERDSITNFIEDEKKRIDSIISKSEREIELLQEYRTALISEAVTGKIDIRKETI